MFFSKFSIKYQMLVLVVLTILLATVVFFSYYSENSDIIIQKNNSYMSASVAQISRGMENYCDTVGRNMTSIAYSSFVQDYMMETDPLKKLELDRQIASLLINMKWNMGDGVLDIVIIGDSGSFSTLNGSYDFINSRREEFAGGSSVRFSAVQDVTVSNFQHKGIVAGMAVQSIDKSQMTGQRIGAVAVILDARAMASGLFASAANAPSSFYVLDRDGKTLASSAGDRAGSEPFFLSGVRNEILAGPARWELDGGSAFVQADSLPSLGGHVVGITPEKALLAELGQVRLRTILSFLVVIAILAIPFTIVIRNMTRPLREFTQKMGRIRVAGWKDPENRISLNGFSEIVLVSREFNGMMGKIEQLTGRLLESNTRLYQAEIEKKHAEIAFLQSQINPHFLYNTLEAICGIASVKGVPEIRDMTKALGRIFNYSVKGRDEVTLGEELDVARSYLQIQQIRFQGRFDVEIAVEPEALPCLVPKMILQPLIENAIYHGLEPMLQKGALRVTGRVASGAVEIMICDNGMGIAPDVLEGLRKDLLGGRGSVQPDSARIGVVNVGNRIRLMYGEQYGLRIGSEAGTGTVVVIALPLRDGTEGEDDVPHTAGG